MHHSTIQGIHRHQRELYKRSISGMFQRCIAFEDGQAILRDIHVGTCGHHASSRSLVAKAFRAGFYWPTAHTRRGGHSQKVHRLSKIRHKAARTRIGVEDNTTGLALRPVGARYGWTTQKILPWRAYLPSGDSRQVHQMD